MSKRTGVARQGVRLLLVLVASGLLYGLLGLGGKEKAAGAVTIYAYSDMLSTEDFDEFTARTGIPVVVRHFEAIEEVITKLVFTKDSGIDLIAPTDSMVEVLVEKKLLDPLDYQQLPSAADVSPHLLGQFYDPANRFSLPFSWSPLGIGYDTRVLKAPREQIGWDIIFGRFAGDVVRPPEAYYGAIVDKVCLGEDPFETIYLAMLYLYGSVDKEVMERHESRITDLLRQQKAWIECYTNNLCYFLVSGVCPAVVIPGAYMIKKREECPWADFVIPPGGSMMYIGNMVLVSGSKRSAQAHQVINYLLSKEGSAKCYENNAFLPANKQACEELPPEVKGHPYLCPDVAVFKQLRTLHNQIPASTIERVWHGAMV